jgi:WD40 repeat protein
MSLLHLDADDEQPARERRGVSECGPELDGPAAEGASREEERNAPREPETTGEREGVDVAVPEQGSSGAVEFAPSEGAIVHGYRLVERLGEGGFGEVWLGEEVATGDRYALKFRRAMEPKAMAALCREAQLGAKLREAALSSGERPPVVSMARDLLSETPPALVMEHVAGGNLRQYMAERAFKPLEPAKALRVVCDIAEALAFAHARGVSHRDLSPENVLFDPLEGRWKTTDFGVGSATVESKLSVERSGHSSSFSGRAGKPHYMAPEQRAGGDAALVGSASDVYALGVLWAQLITGLLDAGLPATWAREATDLSRAAIGRCLEDSPRDRWPHGGALLAELKRLSAPATAKPQRAGAVRAFLSGFARIGAARQNTREGFRQERHFAGHADWIAAMAISMDGHRAATGGLDRVARVWDLRSGDCLQTFEGHRSGVNSVAFSADDSKLLTAGFDGAVRLWDASNGRELLRLAVEGDRPLRADFACGGRRIVAAMARCLAMWDADTGARIVAQPWRWNETGKGWLITTTKRWDALRLEASSAAFSPDGSRVLVGLNSGDVYLASSAIDPSRPEAFGASRCRFQGHSWAIVGVAFSPDGRRAVSAGLEDAFEMWDLENPRELRCFEGHEHWMRCLAYSRDGARVASASRDRSTRVWNAFTGEQLGRRDSDWRGTGALAFLPGGDRLLEGGDDGSLTLWALEFGDGVPVR